MKATSRTSSRKNAAAAADPAEIAQAFGNGLGEIWKSLQGLNLPLRFSVPVAGPLRLTMVWNEGVSFGLLKANHDIVRWGQIGRAHV